MTGGRRGGAAEPARVVVDASVALKWFVAEPGSLEAQQLLEAAAQGDLVLLAPEHWVAECANALWKKLTRLRTLPITLAFEALEGLADTAMSTVPTRTLITRAFAISVQRNCSVYDALYLALALATAARFVTADRRLAAVGRRLGIEVSLLEHVG